MLMRPLRLSFWEVFFSVDWVRGGNLQGLGVRVDGSVVVLARHCGITLRLQLIRLRSGSTGLGSGRLAFLGWRRAAGRGIGGRFIPELLVHAVDGRQRLPTHGILNGGLVGWVYLEGIRDAGLGDFDRFRVICSKGAVFHAGTQEIDDGEREALLRFGWGLRRKKVSCLSS